MKNVRKNLGKNLGDVLKRILAVCIVGMGVMPEPSVLASNEITAANTSKKKPPTKALGTAAPKVFEEHTTQAPKSVYQLDGKPLEIDPD